MILIILAACSTANLNKQLLQIKVFKEERKLKQNSLYMGQFIKLLLSSLICTICPQACNQESEACTMYCVQCILQCTVMVYTTLYSVQCTLQCIVYSTNQSLQFKLYYDLLCTMYIVHAIYTVHCMLYKMSSKYFIKTLRLNHYNQNHTIIRDIEPIT